MPTPKHPNVIAELVEAQIPFTVHFPDSNRNVEGETIFVVTIAQHLNARQVKIMASLDAMMDGEGNFKILTTYIPPTKRN